MTRVGFIDLSGPVATEPQGPQTTPIKPTHTVQPPPQNNHKVRDIAALLLVATSTAGLAAALSALFPRISSTNLLAVAGLARQSAPMPAAASAGPAEKAAQQTELMMRAAYVLAAAERLQKAEQEGKSTRTALSQESTLYERHREAQRGRMQSALDIDKAVQSFGDVLGWYLNPLLNNEIECIKANGHNFRASQGTVIGWPGAVHPHCGCTAGPPIPGAGWVNDSVKPILLDTSGRRLYPRRTA